MEQISKEEFTEKLKSVKVILVQDTVVMSSGEGTVDGAFSYTEGLKDLLGYELVAYGAFDGDDMLASAEMIHANFPRGAAIEIPSKFIDDLDLGIPAGPYRQYILDESQLEDVTQAVGVDPCWTADGGYCLLTDEEMHEALKKEFGVAEKERFDNIEQARDRYRALIKENGFTMVGVFDPQGEESNYVYTAGLSLSDWPEYIVSGAFSMEDLSSFAGHMAQLTIKEGFALRKIENAFTVQDSQHDVRVVEVDPVYAVTNYLIQAPLILKRQVKRVAWIQISDANKRFPGDEGFDNLFRQPVISTVIAGGATDDKKQNPEDSAGPSTQ